MILALLAALSAPPDPPLPADGPEVVVVLAVAPAPWDSDLCLTVRRPRDDFRYSEFIPVSVCPRGRLGPGCTVAIRRESAAYGKVVSVDVLDDPLADDDLSAAVGLWVAESESGRHRWAPSVRALASPRYWTRERADRALRGAGAGAVPELAAAAKLHPDPEVRSRCGSILNARRRRLTGRALDAP